MRFMMLVKADERSEAGVLPSKELVAAMEKFNEEMAKAGVLLAAEGLHPTSKGARLTFSRGKPTVTDGPFPETRDLLAGFWMIQAKSKKEAIEWAHAPPSETARSSRFARCSRCRTSLPRSFRPKAPRASTRSARSSRGRGRRRSHWTSRSRRSRNRRSASLVQSPIAVV